MRIPPRLAWLSRFIGAAAALLPAAVHAQAGSSAGILQRLRNVGVQWGPFSDLPPGASGLQRAAQLAGLVVGALLAFLGVLFIVLMIRAGLRWMLAQGNEQEVEQAKQSIKSAALGLLIVLVAYALVTFISTIITETGLLRTG